MLDNQRLVLVQLLTVVRGSEKLGYFGSTPDDSNFLFSLYFSFLLNVKVDLAQLVHHVFHLFSVKGVS